MSGQCWVLRNPAPADAVVDIVATPAAGAALLLSCYKKVFTHKMLMVF